MTFLQIQSSSRWEISFGKLNFSYFLNLVRLGLANHELIWSISPQISFLPKLRYLNLSSNNLTCELQSSLGNLSQLVDLDFSFNHFFTSIPPELCNLKNLVFELVPKHLHGSKTHSLGTLSFGRFVLGLNIISGSIPTILVILSKLTALDPSRNYINGSILSSLEDCNNLNFLGLSYRVI